MLILLYFECFLEFCKGVFSIRIFEWKNKLCKGVSDTRGVVVRKGDHEP